MDWSCGRVLGLLVVVVIVFLGQTSGDKWLMEGDFVSGKAVRARHLDVETRNSSTITSASMELTLVARQGRRINCIIAAAIYMNGEVRIARGGVGHETVTVAYDSLTERRRDVLFVLVQSHAERPVTANRLQHQEAKGPEGSKSHQLAGGPGAKVHQHQLLQHRRRGERRNPAGNGLFEEQMRPRDDGEDEEDETVEAGIGRNDNSDETLVQGKVVDEKTVLTDGS